MRKRLLSFVIAALLPLSASIPVLASSVPEKTFPVPEQTWNYLAQNPPGSYSIPAHSLAGREQKQQALDTSAQSLATWADNGFTAPDLERAILELLKLEQDPLNYKRSASVKYDLLATLYAHGDLYGSGLTSACQALYCYEAIGEEVPPSARNATVTVLDYIVSSQQRNGGFAQNSGRDPSVTATASALLALRPHRQLSYVDASAQRAIQWLSEAQNANATFSAQKRPSLTATATALIALRSSGLPLDDPRFVKNNADLLDALALFLNEDGGYSPTLGEPSDPTATELAVIAHITNETGLPPYLHPSAYPGYRPPEPPEPDPLVTYLAFFIKFIGMLIVLYFMVIITPKLSNMIDRKRHKYKPDPDDSDTFEIHIPMKAPLPNFDELPTEPPDPALPPDEAQQDETKPTAD